MYKVIDFTRYSTPEMQESTNGAIRKVLEQPIDNHCVLEMFKYTEHYIKLHRERPELGLEKYLDTIIKDHEILKKIQDKRILGGAEELTGLGISICTIKTGLQRLWIMKIKERIQEYTRLRLTKDYQKFRLLPGQHLFYYGAFTGTVTGEASPATHHFVYLYDGIIMEVGTPLIEGCRDVDELADKPSLPLYKKLTQYLYKGTMSYFGFSTLYESTKWAKDYWQNVFYVYDYRNDADIGVVSARLERARSMIGKWTYSLLASNNCENAANYISIGESLSTQACKLDSLISTIKRVSKATTIPYFEIPLIPEIDYTRSYEYDLRSKAAIPTCTGDKTYVERYISDNNYICAGGLNRGVRIRTATCNVDKRYCPRGQDCPDSDFVSNTKPNRVCIRPKDKDTRKVRVIKS
jgi:hypothetical protein